MTLLGVIYIWAGDGKETIYKSTQVGSKAEDNEENRQRLTCNVRKILVYVNGIYIYMSLIRRLCKLIVSLICSNKLMGECSILKACV